LIILKNNKKLGTGNKMRVALFWCLLCLPTVIFADYFRVCYVTNWSQYRRGIAKYTIGDDYVSGLCTHLVFAFAKIKEVGAENFELTNVEPNDFTVGYPQV